MINCNIIQNLISFTLELHIWYIFIYICHLSLYESVIRGVALVLLWRESVSLYTFSSSFTIVAAYHTLYNTVIIPVSLRSRNRSRFLDTTTSIFILRSRFFSTSCNRLSNTFWSEKKSRRRKTSRTKQKKKKKDGQSKFDKCIYNLWKIFYWFVYSLFCSKPNELSSSLEKFRKSKGIFDSFVFSNTKDVKKKKKRERGGEREVENGIFHA